jgi:exoribonuclease-2
VTNLSHTTQGSRAILVRLAERTMVERGLLPGFSREVMAELQTLREPEPPRVPDSTARVRDLRALLWCSIDNDDSRDLDQLTVAADGPGGSVRILVAIADVDALVRKGSAIDEHARQNTTSVYTAAKIFPMLPEQLSTDLTSLNLDEERLAVVMDMRVDADGRVGAADIYRAWVRNRAKLAYSSVGAWLEGGGAAPEAIAAVPGLAENLRMQDRTAQALRRLRHLQGALSLETLRTRATFDDGQVSGLAAETKNRAGQLIEDFMIAANGVTARFLAAKHVASIRRVVRAPKRWDRIVALAKEHGTTLPGQPDSVALDAFLVAARAADPLRFPDLSLSVIKMLGAGEYVAEQPDAAPPGHFGLAVKDYAHSTAPNRRYPDLVTQRLVKAALAGEPTPYTFEALDQLARHITAQEDAANKVERQVEKSAAALFLQARIGESFDALVTGASAKGTWARLLTIPVEGRVIAGFEGADVGDRIRVRLTSVDVERGFIDFARVAAPAR